MAYPICLGLNNPGCIRKSTDVFNGEIVPSSNSDFKEFETMVYGFRAMFKILTTYHKNGYNTINKIISRWAPAHENPTADYINFVSEKSGINANTVLSLNNAAQYIPIVAAMAHFENGQALAQMDIQKGAELAGYGSTGNNSPYNPPNGTNRTKTLLAIGVVALGIFAIS